MDNREYHQKYWSLLVKSLRETLHLSQTELAGRFKTDQGTVSRWERAISLPVPETRQAIENLAREAGLATLDDLAAVVNNSPFPMILVRRDLLVMAASASSGFGIGLTCVEQTHEDERGFLLEFQHRLDQVGFWERRLAKLDYEFALGPEVRRAVLSPISMRGEVYALVQKAW